MQKTKTGHIRLGLCCKFADEPIKFFNTTATHALSLSRVERLDKLARLCRQNAEALKSALKYCVDHGIGAFRVNSQILPLKSHPELGFAMADLPDGEAIVKAFRDTGGYAREHDVRLSLHPDQFILLSSEDEGITQRAIAELEYHATVAAWIGADVINIHGGGAYGDKDAALKRVASRLEKLSDKVRSRLTFENDDRTYTAADLLPLCRENGIPLVFDAHHHRCLGGGLSLEEATIACLETWNREPMFHISSPLNGWGGTTPQRHHDMIDPPDFPQCWLDLQQSVTVEVEAKAKEQAVLALQREFN